MDQVCVTQTHMSKPNLQGDQVLRVEPHDGTGGLVTRGPRELASWFIVFWLCMRIWQNGQGNSVGSLLYEYESSL